ncbi:MBG domain-containing protein [Flavisolibacter ginsenosidimutans]|uniref:T9SS type A sorting domain-containing protein n=1 Tax=Flavisolibacter ginsenosidimutans TaxID=661481 RepID=A0A5B8UGN9_9BACT|nr:MBG domain-containing protein [Flavisolibacter ginsenosidimutans]QEC55807.1 T9SS type A sorting domain-containing protein [Flavisolibacter ginsenosidimutans]
MNKILLFFFLLFCAIIVKAQTTYYWVGGAPASPQNISTLSNWNTSLDGSGAARASSTGATDVLVFDGTNYGGATTTTGIDSVNLNTSITCGQVKFVNGANVVFVRNASGTSTWTVSGDGTTAEDFVIESGCSATLANGPGSQVIVLGGTNNSGRVSGNFAMVTGLQARIANGISTGTSLVFTSGSTFTTNITATSAAYAFGNSSQSTEKWVTFQAGSTCYYDGGYSVMASSSTFQPVNFLSGSKFVVRASNPVGSGGTFVNRKAFANVVIQNGATFTADGPVNHIDTLTITSGSTFVTHTSGQTVVAGDLIAAGSLTAPSGSTNELMLTGNSLQTISGTGTISPASLIVADSANVLLNKNISVAKSAIINGKIDFSTSQLTGTGTFTAKGGTTAVSGTGTLTSGTYIITGVTGATGLSRGITVKGAGLSSGTRITSYTANFDSIYISRPALATASNVALSFNEAAATLATSNAAGFDATNGSVAVSDVKTYNDGINYIINAATATPFGISTGAVANIVNANNVQFHSAATTNASVRISGSLEATSGKVTIRPLDSLWLQPGAILNGTYNANSYFVTGVDASGNVGVFRRDNITGSNLFPIGSASNYLPAMMNPTSTADFALNVFEGITASGLPIGTPLTSLQKQTTVDAVWNVNRVNGSGNASLQLQWTPQLEGTTLASFADSEIGIIKNNGTSWSLPFGTGDNAANKADTTFTNFGQFSIGARPPANPFVFNALPSKTYGDADFSPGVISSNATSPVNYSSSNTAVATIVNSKLHINGTGTTIITATQASDGFYPAANVSQTLTVAKAALTIKADRKTKPEGDPNPALTATYTGFVLNETSAVLSTPAVLSTTATTTSPAGNYLITVSGATAANYNIGFVNDSLIVKPRSTQTITFPAFTTKTYGAADFAIGASSNNNTIPVTYTSSNTGIATIVGNNVHIVGAGTTTITAAQAGNDLFFAATPVSQTLTVNKASLTIRATDTTKNYGEANPAFRLAYTGFVLGESASVLTTQPTVNTTTQTNSAPGYYSLDPTGASAANYNITYTSGRLTIYPATGTSQANLQTFMSNGNTLTVRIYSAAPDLGDVFIYDVNGKLLRRKNIFMAQGFVSTTFAVNGLPSGIYVVQVIGKNTTLKRTTPIIH